MLACLTLVEVNGYKVNMSNQQLEDFAVKIAVKKLSVKTIANWLKQNSTKT